MLRAARAASRGRRRLTAGAVNLTQLGLDDLFVGTRLDLDHTLVIFLSRFRNPENVLSHRNIAQHNTA